MLYANTKNAKAHVQKSTRRAVSHEAAVYQMNHSLGLPELRVPEPDPGSGSELRVRHPGATSPGDPSDEHLRAQQHGWNQQIHTDHFTGCDLDRIFLLVKPLISHFVCWEKDLLGELGTWPQKERPQTFAESTADLYHCLRMLEECVAFS